MISYSFDKNKAINSLLFISKKITDKKGIADRYATLKILYFAEKKHLARYGRLITGDKFAALKYGPVPSNSYDILVEEDLYKTNSFFKVIDNKHFIPILDPDLNSLSESDIECLDESINENGHLGFEALKSKSHDTAYYLAFDNDVHFMSLEDIAKDEGADDQLINYIREHYEMQNLIQCLPA